MIISFNAVKDFETNPTTLHDKCLEDIRDTGTYLKTIKKICSQSIANIKLNVEKIKAIPLKSGQVKAVHPCHID